MWNFQRHLIMWNSDKKLSISYTWLLGRPLQGIALTRSSFLPPLRVFRVDICIPSTKHVPPFTYWRCFAFILSSTQRYSTWQLIYLFIYLKYVSSDSTKQQTTTTVPTTQVTEGNTSTYTAPISKTYENRMWANAQRDARPAEFRWRPLFNAAKFGWRPLLQCRAVTLPRRESSWNLQGCPKLANRSQPLVCWSSPYCGDMWRTYRCLTTFFRIVDTCLSCEDTARQSCAMVPKWRFFASRIFSEPRAAHFRHAF